MGRLILITGGARSGKSSFAEQLAVERAEHDGRIGYIATARALDAEMTDRIARHRAQRPAAWHTFEAPDAPSVIVRTEGAHFDLLLLDCLTVLTTNRILAHDVNWEQPDMSCLHAIEEDLLTEIAALIDANRRMSADLIAVTNEVGAGIVPVAPLSRFFRDCAGRVNQRMASAADQVYFVVSGIPVQIKGKEA